MQWFVVIGQIEDPEERAKQEAAKNFVGTSAAARVSKDSAADDNELMSDAEDVSWPIHSLLCLAIYDDSIYRFDILNVAR